MRRWLENGPLAVYWIVGGVAALSALVRWVVRCRHPNPHYIRAVERADEATGATTVIEPARYICYECGKQWLAKQRDPAWVPTHVVSKFTGYDPKKALRAAARVRAAVHRRPRVNRGNVVDLRSRKPTSRVG